MGKLRDNLSDVITKQIRGLCHIQTHTFKNLISQTCHYLLLWIYLLVAFRGGSETWTALLLLNGW